MSSIDTSTDIPDSIALLEQIHAWSGLALYNLHKGTLYQESEGTVDSGLSPIADASVVTAADKSIRLILRTAIELDPSFVTDSTQKLWMFAREIKDALVPSEYKED